MQPKLLDVSVLSYVELDVKLEKGYQDIMADKIKPDADV